MDVTMPDGTLIQNVPDGTSRADLLARLKATGHDTSAWESAPPRVVPQVGSRSPLPVGGTGGGMSREAVGSVPQPRTFSVDPTDGMSQMDLLRAGFGKSISDTATGIAGMLPGVDNSQEVRDMRQRDAPLMNTTAGQAGDLAGTVGTMLVPGAALKGAGVVVRSLGAPAAADALGAAGGALIAPRGITSGISSGATMGAIQPAASTSERLLNTGAGAVAGGAIPTVSTAYRAGMSALEPFYEAGQQKIVGRVINQAAGSDAPNVVNRLQEATQPFVGPSQGVQRQTMGELVPGSIPTTSQVAGNPGIAALEQATMALNPEVKNTVTAQLRNQNAARVGELQDIAGGPDKRAFFTNERDATAQQLYDGAFKAPLDPQAMAAQQPVFKQLSTNPYVIDAVPAARKLAAGDGVSLDAGSLQGMHYLKLAMDDAISKAANPSTSAGANTLRQMQDAKTRLVGAMEAVSPDYAAARQTYSTMSKPVNQMDVGQALIDKSVGNLDGNIKPTAFANAVTSDKTAQQATGFKGATMEGTLDNQTQNRLQMILDDLSRQNSTTNAGRGIGSNTLQNLAYANMVGQSGMPTFLSRLPFAQVAGNLAGRGLDLAYGKANNQLSALLAQVMSDPAAVASAMRRTGPYANNGLAEILRLGMQPAATALPAAVNANK